MSNENKHPTTWAECINASNLPVVIEGHLLDASAFSGHGARPQTLTIPPRGVVRVRRSYVAKRRTPNGGDMPPIVQQLSGGRLKPHGDAALAVAGMFVDELPEVVLAQAEHIVRDNGVSSRPDPQEANRKLAEEVGRRMLEATAYRKQEAQATPIIEIAEEPPPAE